jgi:nitric oxide reductase NorE protein
LRRSIDSEVLRRSRHLPGEPGVWVLICGDVLVFSLFFITYTLYRNVTPELYSQSQASLNVNLGSLNTVLLLISSWCVASAAQCVRGRRLFMASYLVTGAFLCGLGFIIVKIFEYHAKIAAGIDLLTNDFFMFYFVFTGIHLLHVIIGMGLLLWLRQKTRGDDWRPERDLALFEGAATFWHLVDVLWIILFALLYLVR